VHRRGNRRSSDATVCRPPADHALAAVSGKPDVYAYGFIPRALFAQVKAAFLTLAEKSETAGTHRTP
jgi:hypothetical protein